MNISWSLYGTSSPRKTVEAFYRKAHLKASASTHDYSEFDGQDGTTVRVYDALAVKRQSALAVPGVASLALADVTAIFVSHITRPSSPDLCGALATSEPERLLDLEALLGVNLSRNPHTEDAWILRRDNPAAGIPFLYVAFISTTIADLRQDSNPRIAELRVQLADVRGCKPLKDGAAGTFSVSVDAPGSHFGWVFWKLRDAIPTASSRSSAAESDVVKRVASLVIHPPRTLAGVGALFGVLKMDGRFPEWFATGATWRLTCRPIEASDPLDIELDFSVPQPLAPLLREARWADALIASGDVEMTSRTVVIGANHDLPKAGGFTVQIEVLGEGLRPSSVKIPASAVFEVEGARISRIVLARQ